MGEGVLGKDIKMGDEVWNDVEFLEKIKEICVNNRIRTIQREDLRKFLENVKAILLNNPNEFITIKDIANDNAIKKILENKWNLCSDPDCAVMWFLCHPIRWLSPYILCLECRTHADYAQWALKYNPDKQKDYQDRKLNHVSQILRQRSQELNYGYQRLRQLSQEMYDEIIREMVKFFPDFEGEEELRRQDKLLDEFEEEQKRLKRSIKDEELGDKWR